MKPLKIRAIALILALIIAVSVMGSVAAFADEDEYTPIDGIEVPVEYLGETQIGTGIFTLLGLTLTLAAAALLLVKKHKRA